MYIKDCGYGRSKRCVRKTWPIIGLCVLTLGLCGITTRVMAAQVGTGAKTIDSAAEQQTVAGALMAEQSEVNAELPMLYDTPILNPVEILENEDTESGADESSADERKQDQEEVKIMYLTFDDGPTAESTVSILDTLKEKNIKATFFVVGESVRKNPEVAKRIAREGHTIGIHCNSHDYKEIYKSADDYIADFEEAYQAVYEVTGVKAQIFRFPGGSINSYNKKVYQEIVEKMTDKGYIYYDWNASLEDAVSKSNDPQTLLDNAKESTLGRSKVVMLAHDRVKNTALCLEDLIDQFPEYEMLPLTPEVKPIQF